MGRIESLLARGASGDSRNDRGGTLLFMAKGKGLGEATRPGPGCILGRRDTGNFIESTRWEQNEYKMSRRAQRNGGRE